MSGQNQASKGNPAAKRMSNAALKARRERSWRRGQEAKRRRKAAQAKREEANQLRRALGERTPKQLADAAARARKGLPPLGEAQRAAVQLKA